MREHSGQKSVGVPAPRAHPVDAPVADQLLSRLGRGDRTAYAGLYDLVSGPVFGLCLTVLRDRIRAEDAAHATMVELWRTAPCYDPATSGALAWTLRLARQRATAYARDGLAGGEPSVPDQSRGLFARLTELQRHALDLVFYRGHSLPEAATILDLPPGTVAARVREALVRLRAEPTR